MYDYDYFTKRMGYVIDDVPLGSREAAYDYLVTKCVMDYTEAESFLHRIRSEYLARVRAAKKALKEVRG